MTKIINAASFLAIGKTQESSEGQGFKRYIGLASCHVLALNPNKETADELLGYESKDAPEYVKEDADGKMAIVTFIVRTDPDTNNGIQITNKAQFVLRPKPAYNKDETKVQVIDQYGNFTWADVETAKNGGKIEHAQKLDAKYRMACAGECALVDFLKKYLNVMDAYDYKNGAWVKKDEENAKNGIFGLEHIKDYFKGDFSEIQEALSLQPNNKIKLLWGIQNKDGKQYQTVCTRENLMLNNAAGTKGITKLATDLAKAKESSSGSSNFANTDFRVQELQEFDVQPTNLEQPQSDAQEAQEAENSEANGPMPW